MPKILFALIVCFTTFVSAGELPRIGTIKGRYPYGIRIEDDGTRPTDRQKEHETITIYQGVKPIDRIETFRAYPLYRLDLNGDGYEELIFKTSDGGGRFDWVIVSLKPKIAKPVVLKDIAELSHIEVIGGEAKLITWESYGALFSADTADIEIVAAFDGKRFHLDRASMCKRFESLEIPKMITLLDFNEEGYLHPHKPLALIEAMRYALYGLYVGESSRALEVLRETIHPVDKATLYLSLQELVDELSQSRFWDDITAFNGWRDNDYAVIGEKVIDHFQSWSKEEIVRHLFQEML